MYSLNKSKNRNIEVLSFDFSIIQIPIELPSRKQLFTRLKIFRVKVSRLGFKSDRLKWGSDIIGWCQKWCYCFQECVQLSQTAEYQWRGVGTGCWILDPLSSHLQLNVSIKVNDLQVLKKKSDQLFRAAMLFQYVLNHLTKTDVVHFEEHYGKVLLSAMYEIDFHWIVSEFRDDNYSEGTLSRWFIAIFHWAIN